MPAPEYTDAAAAGYFLAGGAVTSAFSESLAVLAANAGVAQVLVVGMVVPCFAWSRRRS